MMILALAMIPLIVVPLIMDLSPGLDRALVAIDYLVWAAFTVEYVIKLYLAPDRWRFVKANIPDLVIVVVPMLRPLRVLRGARLLRLLRLARLVAFAVEGLSEVRDVLRRRGLSWVLLIALALNLIAAALVLSFERDMPGSNINSYPDALWWAVTTIITASIAAYFVEHNAEQDDLAGRLDRILEWLDTIEAGLRVDEREDQWSHDSAPARSQPTRLN